MTDKVSLHQYGHSFQHKLIASLLTNRQFLEQIQDILGKLNLLWGVKAYYYNEDLSTDDTVKDINKLILEKGYVNPRDLVINLTSMPVEERGMVNTLRISEIK